MPYISRRPLGLGKLYGFTRWCLTICFLFPDSSILSVFTLFYSLLSTHLQDGTKAAHGPNGYTYLYFLKLENLADSVSQDWLVRSVLILSRFLTFNSPLGWCKRQHSGSTPGLTTNFFPLTLLVHLTLSIYQYHVEDHSFLAFKLFSNSFWWFLIVISRLH